jgi:hypothetical protein
MTAYLMAQSVTVSNHTARARALHDPVNGVPPAIISAYGVLEQWSRGARYELWIFTAQDVRDLLDQELATIAAFTGM